MRNHFTREVKELLSLSLEEAIRTHATNIGPSHILLGMIRQEHNAATTILAQDLKLSSAELKHAVEETMNIPATANKDFPSCLPLDREAEKCIRGSISEAKRLGSTEIDSDLFFISLLVTI